MANGFMWGADGRRKTREQIDGERKVAQALMTRGMDMSPVNHWAQGLARVGNAGVGAWKERQLDAAAANNGMADGAARRGLFGGGGLGFGSGGPASSGQPDTPLRAFGRSVFGGAPGSAPTGLPAPNYPAPPPQNSMEPMPAFGQPTIAAPPAGAFETPMTNKVAQPTQSAVPPGVTPVAEDYDPVPVATPTVGNTTAEIPSVSDALNKAFRKVFG